MSNVLSGMSFVLLKFGKTAEEVGCQIVLENRPIGITRLKVVDWAQTKKSPEKMISILVVDDDATCLTIVAAMLKKYTYRVTTVKHPLDALCTLRLKDISFDLVIADVHMPVMNGFELQQQIFKEFNLPVVLMSADDQEASILKGIEGGAAFFIVKPILPDDLKDLWQYAAPRKSLGPKATLKEIGSNEAFKSVSSGNGDGQSSKDSKRKSPNNNKKYNNVDSSIPRKAKFVWTYDLHYRFLEAIRYIGPEKAVPRNIMEVMNVPGLTREQVASHLQKYRICLRRFPDGNVPLWGLAGNNLQSSFVYGNPSASMLNNLGQQQMGSLSLHQRIGGRHSNVPLLSSSNPSSVSYLNQSAGKLTPPGYGQSPMLSNQGISSSLMTTTNSMLMWQPPTQASQSFLSNTPSTYGSSVYGAHAFGGILDPIQNPSQFNTNHLGYYNRTPEEQNFNGNGGADTAFNGMNKPSIYDNLFSQQPSDQGDFSCILNKINISSNNQQNEQVIPNFGSSIVSNRVGDTPIMNHQSIEQQLVGGEVTGSSLVTNVIQSDDPISWFAQSPGQHQGGIVGDTAEFINTNPGSTNNPSPSEREHVDLMAALLTSDPYGEGDKLGGQL